MFSFWRKVAVSSANGVRLFVTGFLAVYLNFVMLFAERLLDPNYITD